MKFLKELFQSLLSRYQIWLEKSMKDSEYVFDCFQLLYYNCHKINPSRGESYIDSSVKIQDKKQKSKNNPYQ